MNARDYAWSNIFNERFYREALAEAKTKKEKQSLYNKRYREKKKIQKRVGKLEYKLNKEFGERKASHIQAIQEATEISISRRENYSSTSKSSDSGSGGSDESYGDEEEWDDNDDDSGADEEINPEIYTNMLAHQAMQGMGRIEKALQYGVTRNNQTLINFATRLYNMYNDGVISAEDANEYWRQMKRYVEMLDAKLAPAENKAWARAKMAELWEITRSTMEEFGYEYMAEIGSWFIMGNARGKPTVTRWSF